MLKGSHDIKYIQSNLKQFSDKDHLLADKSGKIYKAREGFRGRMVDWLQGRTEANLKQTISQVLLDEYGTIGALKEDLHFRKGLDAFSSQHLNKLLSDFEVKHVVHSHVAHRAQEKQSLASGKGYRIIQNENEVEVPKEDKKITGLIKAIANHENNEKNNEKAIMLKALDDILYNSGYKMVRKGFFQRLQRETDEDFKKIKAFLLEYGNADKSARKPFHKDLMQEAVSQYYSGVEEQVAYLQEVSVLNPGVQQGSPRQLGKGTFNSVYRAIFKIGNSIYPTAFKPIEQEGEAANGPTARQVGITTSEPSARNLATRALDKRLGFDVIVETKAGTLELSSGEKKKGIVMALAPGYSPEAHRAMRTRQFDNAKGSDEEKSVYAYFQALRSKGIDKNKALEICRAHLGAMELQYDEQKACLIRKDAQFVQAANVIMRRSINYQDPIFRKKLNQLQFIDSIAGQVDRHFKNYNVQVNLQDKCLGVKGYDNDVGWGKDLTSLADIQKDDMKDVHLPRLPLIADQETYDAIMGMSEEDLIEEVGSFLVKEEMDAAKARLREVQEHLQKLQEQKRIIPATEAAWSDGAKTPNGESVTALLSDPQTSYVGREVVRTAKFFENYWRYNEVDRAILWEQSEVILEDTFLRKIENE